MSLKSLEAYRDILELVAQAEGVSRVLFVTSSVEEPFLPPGNLEASPPIAERYKSRTGLNIRRRLGLVE